MDQIPKQTQTPLANQQHSENLLSQYRAVHSPLALRKLTYVYSLDPNLPEPRFLFFFAYLLLSKAFPIRPHSVVSQSSLAFLQHPQIKKQINHIKIKISSSIFESVSLESQQMSLFLFTVNIKIPIMGVPVVVAQWQGT